MKTSFGPQSETFLTSELGGDGAIHVRFYCPRELVSLAELMFKIDVRRDSKRLPCRAAVSHD